MLSIKEKKDWAKLLYLKSDMTQDEIAIKVGVQRKTIGSWINDEKENWKLLKSNFVITKEQELRRLYIQINELNTFIANREDGGRYANPKEADTLSKLAAAARSLEIETSVSSIIDVFILFDNWLMEVDFEKAKEWIDYQDAFIKDRLKR